MSNTLIDLEGLEAFYTKVLTEDLSEYARYDNDSLIPSEIVAPTLVGGKVSIAITNNDSRPLTFYYGRNESLVDKDDPDSFEASIRIDAGMEKVVQTHYTRVYYVKAYADDGAESPVYTVLMLGDGSDD